jgi:hypothetical protein
VAVEVSIATPVLTGTDESRGVSGEVAGPGVVHFGTSPDGAWQLEIGDTEVESRTGFGATSAYDVTAAGPAELRYQQPASRTLGLLLQALLWVAVLLAASRIALPARLRPRRTRDETLLDFDAEPGAGLPDHDRTGFAGWVDELFDEEERTEHEQEESR